MFLSAYLETSPIALFVPYNGINLPSNIVIPKKDNPICLSLEDAMSKLESSSGISSRSSADMLWYKPAASCIEKLNRHLHDQLLSGHDLSKKPTFMHSSY